jgi:hypothetical protein
MRKSITERSIVPAPQSKDVLTEIFREGDDDTGCSCKHWCNTPAIAEKGHAVEQRLIIRSCPSQLILDITLVIERMTFLKGLLYVN